MARLGASKNKKSPRATELTQLKKNCSASTSSSNPIRESSPKLQNGNGDERNPACDRQFADRSPVSAGCSGGKRGTTL